MLPVYTRAVSGMQAAQDGLDITANNIANADTPGFDATDISLADLGYQDADPRNLVGVTTGTAQGAGAVVEATPRAGQFGQPVPTGNPLDVAIAGDGYLQVTPPGGGTAYTRLGSVRVDGAGHVTVAGNLLQPLITLPTGARNPQITPTGAVQATVNGQVQTIGQIQLARFPNSQGLQPLGDSLYAATPTAGTAITGTPGQTGFGAFVVGSLEAARVDLSREMASLIIGERAFTLNARALQTVDAMIGDVTHR